MIDTFEFLFMDFFASLIDGTESCQFCGSSRGLYA